MARLLNPADFGLVGMVTAITGSLNLIRDFGLSAATVQRADVSQNQLSTLFWLNVLVGAGLTAVATLFAPLVARFYHEPRLFWVTVAVATGLFFNAAGDQHSALLRRQMRFTTLSLIDFFSWIVSTVLGIGAAIVGAGYWAVVVVTVSLPLTSAAGAWLTAGWIPGRPHMASGIRPLVRFGGAVTLNSIILFVGSNFEKVLLGRFWGAEAIGLYGRAYQLIRIPTDTLTIALGDVAFSTLSRIQNDPARLRSYFLKAYSLVLALTLPATLACAVFADDLIAILLGPKWTGAAAIFRLLAPGILASAISGPLSWLLTATGLVRRSLNMSFVIAPLMIVASIIGIPYGPKGVATACSIIMLLWLVPVFRWSLHGTVISVKDAAITAAYPLLSAVVAGALALAIRFGYPRSSWRRLVLECAVLLVVYVGMLLFAMRQKNFYLGLLRSVLGRSSAAEAS
jgi:PST family polysaccharide transporter